jgi:FecR protein
MRWGAKLAIAIAVVTSFVVSGATSAHAADHRTVGMATKVVSPAQVEDEPAAVGTLAHMNDELRTGAKARLQVSFRDSTQLNLGENATVVVDRFVYDPDAGTGEVVLKTGVAALRMATGKISEMQNKKITVSAPFATLGVRGTDFWWGPIDGHFGVLLLSESKLDVRNDAGAVLIDKAGYGTDIHAELKGGWGPPSPPYRWDPGKVQRAVSQTNVGLIPAINPGILAPGVIPLIIIQKLQSEPPAQLPPPQPRTHDGPEITPER